MRDRIEKVLEGDIKPALAMHGGSVELVDITDDNVVKVKLTGACSGCPMAQMTVLGIVENILKSRIPEIKSVELC